MLVPILFLIRRLAYVASALFLGNYLIAQICIQIGMSMATVFSINLFNSLETRFKIINETFNEAITLILIYFAMCFSGNFILQDETRNNFGFIYIGQISFNISIQLLLLSLVNLCNVKKALRKRWHQRQIQAKTPRPIT